MIWRELGSQVGIAWSLNSLGDLAWQQGDFLAARALYEESLAIRRELGDPRGIAWSLNGLGRVAQRQGDFEAAQRYHEESLALRRKLGDQRGIMDCVEELAQAVGGTGEAAGGTAGGRSELARDAGAALARGPDAVRVVAILADAGPSRRGPNRRAVGTAVVLGGRGG